MRSNLFLLAILCIPFKGWSQNEIGVSLGGAILTEKPSNIDVQSSFAGTLYGQKEFRFRNRMIIQPTLYVQVSEYIMDGHFEKSPSEKANFQITPSNYKQHEMSITSLRGNLFVKYQIFSNASGEGISIGLGSYIEYLMSKKQLFKIDQSNYSENAPIDNSILWGISLDFGTSGVVQKSNRVGFGAGLHYQLSNYLEENPSFKPIIFYIRVGLRI